MLQVESDSGFRLKMQTSSAPVAEGAAKLLMLVEKATKQIRLGQTRGRVTPAIPPVDVFPDEPPPLAWVIPPLSSLGKGLARLFSLRWVTSLPDWAQPIAWGLAFATPALAFLIRLAKGPSLMPWYLLCAIVCFSIYSISSMIHEYHHSSRTDGRSDI